jgi:cytochrome c peroxidase
MRPILPALLAALIAVLLAGAHTSSRADAPWDLPPGVPPPAVPDLGAMTPARVALGRQLFYDVRLSATGQQSCGTCHRREFAFTDARPRAIGATGQVHPRSSMSLVNVAYRGTLTWANPELTTLEDQALVPMFGESPIEMGLRGQEGRIYPRLAEDVIYARLFAAAFAGDPAPVTTPNVVAAIAAFERSIVSFRSPYDRYRFRGERDALSPAARRGEALFFSQHKAGCGQCHRGVNLDGDGENPLFHNTGLFVKYVDANAGLSRFTGRDEDEGKFRAPTLRNIARTAPYMHDGSIPTLAEVLDHYAVGGRAAHRNRSTLLRPLTLSPAERDDLLAFLESLTDVDALVDSRWGDPWRTRYE